MENNRPEGPGRTATIVAVVVFVIVVSLILGIPFYRVFMAPWRDTILQVKGVTFTRGDLVKRLRLIPTPKGKTKIEVATTALREIQQMELIRQEALKRNIKVSDQELDQEIRRRVSASATGEGKFEDLYAATLRGLRLKEREFRTWVELDIYRDKLFEQFVKEAPDVARHVHLYTLVAGTAEKADALRTRIKKGEDFSKLAEAESIDLETAKKGGDSGWMPEGVSDARSLGQIHALGILTRTKEEAEKIRKEILAGGDFGELARYNSLDDASRERGGYLGWVSVDFRAGIPYAADAYKLAPGELSLPIDTNQGFWVIKLLEKSPEGRIVDDIAFHQPLGEVSPPLNTIKGHFLIKVVAREDRRPLALEHRAILAGRKLEQWLAEASERGSKEGWLKWDWGSETYDWVVAHLD